MSKPRLSICIATYNRAGCIGETLESIIPQVTDEVEIVVVDGASTDSTFNVVQHYAEICEQLNYIRLRSKGGVDHDYCIAVEHAQGEMCWLFPDDDILKPDAISTVLDEAKSGYSLIVVNSQVRNKDLSKIISNRLLNIYSNEIYNEFRLEQLFQRVIPYISFIGCVVINRELWLQREKKCYFGTDFIHVGVIFQAPLPAPALVIAKPFISIRYGNAQWASRSFEIWLYKWPNLLYSFTHIPEQVRQKYLLTKFWPKLKYVISSRAKGSFSLNEFQKCFSSKNTPLWWKMASFCIAVIPCSIVNFVILSYGKMMKKESRMAIYDLENARSAMKIKTSMDVNSKPVR